ncbi:hypothetical protein K2X33_09330 [bacterium]|nr:hypothetical protein [bacterium]
MIQDKSVIRKSDQWQGRRFAFAVCGGIGAVESVKSIRELRRHGADITAFLTPSALRFITELSVSWAAAKPAICQPDAAVEHLDPFDWVIVAPTTLNTLAACANGLTENAVTLLAASQLGRRGRIAFVPAMNAQLSAHPLYAEYRARLQSWGADFYPSAEEEGRFKMPAPEALASWLLELTNAR